MNWMELIKEYTKRGLGVPIALVVLLGMMVLPIPPILLDFFFTFNIAFSLVVILAVIYTSRPLDFAVFPTVILLSTLFRLALNVASTRVVLLHGFEGPHAAGHVIQSFGEVVIGGNYAVGFAVFMILIIINFVVVTKGAGRISEVSARFTLDAMPGKQMAIDADLNAGLITQEEAKTRRSEVALEADFYGAMDGASKFVRGDAIAGILILIVNLLGGIGIGTLQQSLSFLDAMKLYALLTIGDGLVAQIPALLLSTAAAIIVTRVSKNTDMGSQISSQLFENPKVLIISGCIIFFLGIIPGMPHLSFIILGAALLFSSYYMNVLKKNKKIESEKNKKIEQEKKSEEPPEKPKEFSWDDVSFIDPIGLEIGYRLVPLVGQNGSAQLMGKIKGIRKKVSQELGFLIPPVHIRDNLDLNSNSYRISVMGVNICESMIQVDKDLAVNPGKVFGELAGVETVDPVFNLKSIWIDTSQREYAQTLGYTVVDSSTVVATHLMNVLKRKSYQLFGHEELKHVLERIEKISEKLSEELKKIPSSVLVKVFQGLLMEQVPIKDLRTISEVLAEHSHQPEPTLLIQSIRIGMNSLIVQNIVGSEAEIPVVTIEPNLEQILLSSLKGNQGAGSVIEPDLYNKMHKKITEISSAQDEIGSPTVLLVHPDIRNMIVSFFKNFISSFFVLSYAEIPDDRKLRIIGSLGN